MTARLTAPDRLARLLAVVPYVAGRGAVPIDEIAARFSYPRADLVADLTDVVQYVGVAPFTPDSMIEVTVDDEHVWIVYAKWFERPMRLDPNEALTLLAAGRTLLASTGDEDDSPLFRGLAKLAAALGASNGVPVDIVLGAAEERSLAVVRAAVLEHRCVLLDYYSYGRDQRSERVVEPHRCFSDDGQWYVGGWCRLAQADRVFRVDRIHTVQLLDEHFAAPAIGVTAIVDPSAAEARATLDLAPEAQWVVAQYPHETVQLQSDGWTRVTLAVTARAWLERLLVRLGPYVRVIELSPELGDTSSEDTAQRILARYQASRPRELAGPEPHKGPTA